MHVSARFEPQVGTEKGRGHDTGVFGRIYAFPDDILGGCHSDRPDRHCADGTLIKCDERAVAAEALVRSGLFD